MIGIVNTGAQNIGSIKNCLNFLKIKFEVINSSNEIKNFHSHIILPGVGNFESVIKYLKKNNFKINELRQKLLKKKVFAICVGMQILFENSEESKMPGLKIFPGSFKNLKTIGCKGKIPHIGFNKINTNINGKLEKLFKKDFYFVHSYALDQFKIETKSKYFVGKTLYGKINFVSLLITKNIISTQFHPEKSGNTGLKLFKYFYGQKKSYI